MSLRTRIAVGSTLVAILLLGLASIVVFAQLTSVVEDKERAVLHGITEVYRGAIESGATERFEAPGPKQHVAVIAPDGSQRMNTLPAGLHDRLEQILAEGPRLHSIRTPEASFYVYVDPVATEQGVWQVISTRDVDLSEEVLDEVAHLLIAVLVSAAVVFAVGSWVVAGAALRPVERMRRSAQDLAVAQGGVLLSAGPAPDELSALARTLNDLLERTRAAADRERQMVSDASHELRNPLAVLQAQLDLVDGTDPESDEATIRDARRTLSRLSRIADSLLQLSRIDAAPAPGLATLADAGGAVMQAVDRARLRASELASSHTLDVDFEIEVSDPHLAVRIGVDDLGRIVDNLAENALAASDGDDLQVMVRLRQHGERAVLTVHDDAGGFAADIADRAFERFMRGSAASYSGGGLGLAIVARLASRAGGTARVDNRPGEGATVVVELPVVDPDSSAPVARDEPNTHQ